MEFLVRLEALSKKIDKVANNLTTEEATKNALIMPFIHSVLGYDVFDPNEVIPEFTADTGIKKGEKVDYALIKDKEIQILIECKKFGEPLTLKHASQLFRYFSVTNARLAILTNGSIYQFYTDLDNPNKMDEKPFLTLDLNDIDEHIVPEIKKITKESFDINSIINAAGDLKYLSQLKKIIQQQFDSPEDDFVRFFASRIYDGVLTSKVRAQFLQIVARGLKQFLADSINDRLKSAIDSDQIVDSLGEDTSPNNSRSVVENNVNEFLSPVGKDNSNIVTTQEEIDGFNIVRAIVSQNISVERVIGRDRENYFGILLDDNNRKAICRLHFNTNQNYFGTFDKNKKETRHPIKSLSDIFNFQAQLLATIDCYEGVNDSGTAPSESK